MKKLNALLPIFILVLAALFLIQRQQIHQLRTHNKNLLDQAAQLSANDTTISRVAANDEHLGGSNADKAELLRLRAEMNTLRRMLRDATNNPVPTPLPSVAVPDPSPATPEPPVKVFQTTAHVLLQPGDTFMIGGWETSPGKRTVVFAAPSVIDAAGNADPAGNQVVVRTHFIEVPEALLQSIDTYQFARHDGLRKATFTESRARELLEQLRETAEVSVLTAPVITAADGRQTQIAIQDVRTFDGEQRWVGPTVDLVPVIAQNGAVNLSITPTLSLPNPNWRP